MFLISEAGPDSVTNIVVSLEQLELFQNNCDMIARNEKFMN